MVHPGHPSGACSTCKARRIKCDETRPRCGPCTKSNRTCLGYPSQVSDGRRTWIDAQANGAQLRTPHPLATRVELGTPLHAAGCVAVHFGESFILNPSRSPSCVTPGFLDGLESVLAQSMQHGVLQQVVDVFAIGHRSLGEAMQTIRQRNKQLHRYQQAIRHVKESTFAPGKTQSLVASIYLLALYEMLVNSSSVDRTWQTHLNGLLALFSQAMPLQTTHPMTESVSHILLLLDALQARFRHLSLELDDIFCVSATPRKLDVQKLRAVVKPIFKELVLVRSIMSKEEPWKQRASISSIQDGHAVLRDVYSTYVWNKLHAMLIASAIFLQQSGEYILTGNNWGASSEFQKLTKIIAEAVTALHTSAARRFGEYFPQSISRLSSGPCLFRTIEGLLWMWPLYVATQAPGVPDTQRWWVKTTLLGIGLMGGIPKASMLAESVDERLNYYEFCSAITLLDFGFIVTQPLIPSRS